VGVNYAIKGELPSGMTFQKSVPLRQQKQIRCMVTKAPTSPQGLAIIHPYNPMASRMSTIAISRSVMALNRYWWFGSDLTPAYLLRKMQFISIRCIKFATSTIPPIPTL